MGVLAGLENPIVQAPMAGGPSTVELAASVCDAGGLGFLAAGYRDPEELRYEIQAMRGRVFGVNLFVPGRAAVDSEALAAYVESLGPGAGEPRFDDDRWRAKLDVLRDSEPVSVVSFAFGRPPLCEVRSLQAHGSEVWVTVTSVYEAQAARDAGADVLVAQGLEAGGHRGTWVDAEGLEALRLLPVLKLLLSSDVGLPVVAAGGGAPGPRGGPLPAAGAAPAPGGAGG